MPTLVQAPTKFTIELEIERRGAQPHHLKTYLEREIKKAMNHAQFSTPAGSKLVSVRVTVQDDE